MAADKSTLDERIERARAELEAKHGPGPFDCGFCGVRTKTPCALGNCTQCQNFGYYPPVAAGVPDGLPLCFACNGTGRDLGVDHAAGVDGKSPEQLRQELLSGQWDLSKAAEKPTGVRACATAAEWWSKYRDNPYWSGSINDTPWDELWPDAQAMLTALFEGARGVAACGAPQWRGLTKDEIDHAVGELVEYGTEFVAPLYSVVEGIERKLRERNAGADWRGNTFEGAAAMSLPNHQFWGAGEPDCPPELKAPNGELHTMRCKVCGDGWRKSRDVCITDAQREFAALSEPARLALVGASTAIMNGVHARAYIEHNPDRWLCFQFNTWDEVDAALRAVKAWDSAGYRAKDDAAKPPALDLSEVPVPPENSWRRPTREGYEALIADTQAAEDAAGGVLAAGGAHGVLVDARVLAENLYHIAMYGDRGNGEKLMDAIEDALATAGVPPSAEPLRHATKENGDCPSWCKACAAEAAARGVSGTDHQGSCGQTPMEDTSSEKTVGEDR